MADDIQVHLYRFQMAESQSTDIQAIFEKLKSFQEDNNKKHEDDNNRQFQFLTWWK